MKSNNWIRTVALFLATGLLFLGSIVLGQTVHAKELENVITKVLIWDDSNGREATKLNGNYVLVENVTYSLQTEFDLKAYDNDLADGDYFTFTISPSLTVNANKLQLVDTDTKVEIGEANIVSNGTSQGATVKVTLKNLADYAQKKQSTSVTDVKGNFYIKLSSQVVGNNQSATITGVKDTGTTTIKYNTNARSTTDNSTAIGRENFAKIGGVITNRPYQSNTLNTSGTYVHPWRLRLNTKQAQYNTLVVSDKISLEGAPMQFIPERFTLRIGESTNQGWVLVSARVLEAGKDYTVEFNDKYTEFTLTILDPQAKPYVLEYETTAPADGSTVGNTVSVSANGSQINNNDVNKAKEVTVSRVSKVTEGGSTQIDPSYRIVVYKVDEETNQPLAGAQFEITKPDGSKVSLPETDAKGRAYSDVFTEAEAKSGEFTITEVAAPAGYVLNATPLKVKLSQAGIVRTISNKRQQTTDIAVKKVWDDAENQDGKRPDSINIALNKTIDGVTSLVANQTIRQSDNWQHTFANLPLQEDGTDVIYNIEEEQVDGYQTPVVTGNVTDGFTITNTRTPETVAISGKKVWDDANNQDGKRPANIAVKITHNATVVDTIMVTPDATGQWTFTSNALPKYANGKEISYSVEEEQVEGYQVPVVTGNVTDGFTITNTRTPETVAISGKKVWDDANNQDGKRPTTITVRLLADGREVASQELSADINGDWNYRFVDQPKYKAGTEIVYSIAEDAVADYTTSIEQDATNPYRYIITNQYTPESISISGRKIWDDEDNKDKIRPESIIVRLYANGVKVNGSNQVVDAASNWQYRYENLARYEKGSEIIYTVDEIPVEGYTLRVEGYDLINYHEPTTTTTEETTTSSTTTTEEPSTTIVSTTTTSEEPTTTDASTTTTSEEPSTSSAPITTEDSTTDWTTTVTSEESTTTVESTTTTEEPSTTDASTSTTSEDSTTTVESTTTTEEPSTTDASTSTTSEESTTTVETTTTTEEPSTTDASTSTTTEDPGTTTTSTSTTSEDSTSTSESTTTTTENPVVRTSEDSTPPDVTPGKKAKVLPHTGETGGLTTTLVGVILLAAAALGIVFYRKSKKDKG